MKPSKSHLILLALFILALQASCFSLSDVASLKFNSRPIMNAYASSTGEISILKDLDGYYVNTDLAYHVNQEQVVGNDTAKMMLGLSNNNILLIDSCLNFNQYPCDYYHCTRNSGAVATINYPNFVASTIKASADAYLDYGYWDAEEQVLLATACSTSASNYTGKGRFGILGLGTEGSSKNNFLKTRLFSIYFYPDLQSGVLKFANDQKYVLYNVGNVTASANWIIPVSGYIQISPYDQDFKGFLAFDMNANALGFPLKLYQYVVDKIIKNQWLHPIVCTNDTFQPTCNYTGYVKDLPEIYISTGQHSVGFNIPPEIYVKNAKNKTDYVYSITLNIKALDPSLSNESYVTSDYNNTIIMDARTMSHFYLVFDATSGSNVIKIYEANPDPNAKNPPPKWWVYLILVLVVVLIISAICCNKRRAARKSVPTIVVPNTSQEPLIIANNYAQPVISSGGYDYQQNMNFNNPQYPGGVVPTGNTGHYYQQQQQQPQGIVYAPPPAYDGGNTGAYNTQQ